MKTLFLTILLILSALSASSKPKSTTVAIIIDSLTYSKVVGEVSDYMKSINTIDGKKTHLIVAGSSMTPNIIRDSLYKLYIGADLEGAILIGEIPIPMIRDAQHLTTAFKMDQKLDWKRSSIPSDRFYDDFDLKFDFIKRDSDNKLLFYYSLKYESTHHILCDIYTSRIKPPVGETRSSSEYVSDFLKKAVRLKNDKRVVSKVFHFAGHGYNSESMVARIDENRTLRQQFPLSKVSFLNYDEERIIKPRLMATLSDNSFDLAILHHHGSDDLQYLSKTPYSFTIDDFVGNARKFFRSKIRSSKDTSATKQYYISNYGAPEAWVNDAFSRDKILSDSLFDASLNISIDDIKEGFKSAPRVIILDACFNGSFDKDDYMASRYLFNEGSTMVVRGNSVNVIQDNWVNEFVGLSALGVSAGNWMKENMTLESHIFGDATFSFSSNDPSLDFYVSRNRGGVGYWKKSLKSDNPDLKALAVKRLFELGYFSSSDLLKILKGDKSEIVRMESFNILMEKPDENVVEAILTGFNDSYELIQRLSARYASLSGAPEILAPAANLYTDPTLSARVKFQLKDVFNQYSMEEVIKVFNVENLSIFAESFRRSIESDEKEFNALSDSKTSLKEKKFTIRGQKNLCNQKCIDSFLELLRKEENNEIRLMTAETLGWYKYSVKRDYIIQQCEEILVSEKDEIVKNEILKTINRLK